MGLGAREPRIFFRALARSTCAVWHLAEFAVSRQVFRARARRCASYWYAGSLRVLAFQIQ